MKKVMWADEALGFWLLFAPLTLGYSSLRPVIVAEDLLPGIFLIATASWILTMKIVSLRVSWVQALSGLWLIIGSFVLIFSRLPHAALNALIVGVLVLGLYVMLTRAFARQSNATA